MDTAAHSDEGARARQSARNIPRKRPVLALDSGKAYLKNALATDNIRRPRFQCGGQRVVSEWLTTAFRHKPFHNVAFQCDAFVKLRPTT
eukprot:7545117-Pyramimonas_sp.AAC.1